MKNTSDLSELKTAGATRPTEKTVPVSIAIITKNEEKNLPFCLASISRAKNIVLVDSGSTDNTIEIALKWGCRIYTEEWKGYGCQKQSAIEKCSTEWVLLLDADETIPEETWHEIEKAIKGADFEAFSFPRKNFYRGKWLRHGYEWPDRVVRLFKKEKAGMCGSMIHESVIASKVEELNSPILHSRNNDLETYLGKLNTYSTLLARVALENGKKGSALKAASSFLAHFFRIYLLKKGFLDGREGFIVAFTEALNTFYKYLKLMELQEQKEVSRNTGVR